MKWHVLVLVKILTYFDAKNVVDIFFAFELLKAAGVARTTKRSAQLD